MCKQGTGSISKDHGKVIKSNVCVCEIRAEKDLSTLQHYNSHGSYTHINYSYKP